jgi:hypothetical protein
VEKRVIRSQTFVENKSISAYDPMKAGMGNDTENSNRMENDTFGENDILGEAGMGNDFDENDTLGETDRRVRIEEFGSESSCDTVQRYIASSADLEAVGRVSVDLTSHPPFFLDVILIHICAHPNSFANLIMISYAAYIIHHTDNAKETPEKGLPGGKAKAKEERNTGRGPRSHTESH